MAVVGADADHCVGGLIGCGSAYVYRFDGSIWVEEQKLTASDAAHNDHFGVSVSVSGDVAVVGALYHDLPAGLECGSAYVYRFNGSNWVEQVKLTASDAAGSDLFGRSVSVNEDVAVVGGYRDNCGAGVDCGSAYVLALEGLPLPADCNANGVADECESPADCNGNVVQDICDVAAGTSTDCNNDTIPDECQLASNDCNGNTIHDDCESPAVDCNANGLRDLCDIAAGTSEDCNANVVPDECDPQADCNNNGTQDICDVAGGTSLDCNGDEVPDECQLGSNDCNANAVPDSCDVAGGTSSDENMNNVPDECEGPQNIEWNSDLLSPDRTTRSLRFRVNASVSATGAGMAIKVTMIDLQHPKPRNLAALPPPNFTTFDTRVNGVCVGGSHPGHHCDTNTDCPAPATCTGGLTGCTAAGEMNGCARWVGKPGTFLESQDNPAIGNYRAARLQCTPYYHDWTTEGLITVVGGEIAPSSEYSVQTYGASCTGAETGCTDVSAPATMFTRRCGDVEVSFNPPSVTSQPNVTDVVQLVNKFKNLPGALVKAITQLQPNLPELNADINALDIVAVVDVMKQSAYRFSGPCPCPSTVTCESMSCSTVTPCVTAFGAGSMCVKTCTGGDNDGDPCINNSHCPGGSCGGGFCRDRCGRCTP